MTIATRRRSWLFTPATKPDRFDRAVRVGADVLIIDLEDAVAPSDKATARRTALDYLAKTGGTPVTHALRINPPSTPPAWKTCWPWCGAMRGWTMSSSPRSMSVT